MARVLKEVDGATTPGAGTNLKLATREITDGQAASGVAQEELVGYLDDDGDFQPVDEAHPLPVAGSFTASGAPPARNTYGVEVALPAGQTADVVQVTASASLKVRGFVVMGDADGVWRIRYGGVVKYATRTNYARPGAEIVLPNPDAVANGTVVTLEVTNAAGDAGNYEGTLLAE